MSDTVPAQSTISDLSYRGYDGPLKQHTFRWWIVALSGIRIQLRNKWYWVASAILALPWFGVGLMIFLAHQAIGATGGAGQALTRPFRFYFFTVFSSCQLFVFAVALIVAAGSVCNDNRANALTMYLARPITKADYLVGKLVGAFVPVFGSLFVPATLLYLFCLTSYASSGFIHEDPWLFLQLTGACAIAAAIHTSLLCGWSAWAKSSWVAGAVHAGVYFGVASVTGVIWVIRDHGRLEAEPLLRHASLQGIINGLAQNLFHYTIQSITMRRRTGEFSQLMMHPPPPMPLALMAAGLVVLGITLMRMRIRAVEVVRG